MAKFSSYIPQGLQMLAFPCPQFGGQELKSDAAVKQFTLEREFEGIVMSIGDVKGTNARESWRFFYEQTGAKEPTWNFKGKFLVSRTGVVSVPGKNLEEDIKRLLAEKA